MHKFAGTFVFLVSSALEYYSSTVETCVPLLLKIQNCVLFTALRIAYILEQIFIQFGQSDQTQFVHSLQSNISSAVPTGALKVPNFVCSPAVMWASKNCCLIFFRSEDISGVSGEWLVL